MTINAQTLIKSELISVRAIPAERRVLDLIAQQERRRPSEVVRELIRAEAARRGLWPDYTKREVTA